MSKNIVQQSAQRAKIASLQAARLTSTEKNKILKEVSKILHEKKREILRANDQDILAAQKKNLDSAFIDRLSLNTRRLDEMRRSLEALIKLQDPVGKIVQSWKTKGGLKVKKVRIPLGVIGIIFESRPDVTIDTAAICMKSGNAIILRGGKEAYYSNKVLSDLFRSVLKKNHFNPDIVQLFPSLEHKDVLHLLEQDHFIDLIIPRGGASLMAMIRKFSKIPVIRHDKGVCHIFVDRSADLKMAHKVVMNAKTQRFSTCNTLECLLVDQKIARRFLPPLMKAMKEKGVEISSSPSDWGKEFLGPTLAIRTVKNIDQAIAHIQQYGSLHTESIITKNSRRAQQFLDEVLASVVMHNASTRLNDGYQLGLGAEVGISTTKLHAFGPMGLEELTTTKFVVEGAGHIRN